MNQSEIAYKHQKEIQDMIDLIISTAKLIGYTISVDKNVFNAIYFRLDSIKPVATIIYYITVDNEVRLQVQRQNKTINLVQETQEDKIKLLKDLMRRL